VANERLEMTSDGNVRLLLKNAFRDGTAAVEMQPLALPTGGGEVDSYVVDFAHLRPSFCRGIGHIRISYVAYFLAEHDPVEPEAEK